MELRLTVTTTDETYEVVTTPLAVIRWERKMKAKVSALSSGNIGLEDLAYMAYESSKSAGKNVPANFDDWLARLRKVEPVADETPGPTNAAPSDE